MESPTITNPEKQTICCGYRSWLVQWLVYLGKGQSNNPSDEGPAKCW
jgi:hypothetical protein